MNPGLLVRISDYEILADQNRFHFGFKRRLVDKSIRAAGKSEVLGDRSELPQGGEKSLLGTGYF